MDEGSQSRSSDALAVSSYQTRTGSSCFRDARGTPSSLPVILHLIVLFPLHVGLSISSRGRGLCGTHAF